MCINVASIADRHCIADSDRAAYGQWVDYRTQTILMPRIEKQIYNYDLFSFIGIEKSTTYEVRIHFKNCYDRSNRKICHEV